MKKSKIKQPPPSASDTVSGCQTTNTEPDANDEEERTPCSTLDCVCAYLTLVIVLAFPALLWEAIYWAAHWEVALLEQIMGCPLEFPIGKIATIGTVVGTIIALKSVAKTVRNIIYQS